MARPQEFDTEDVLRQSMDVFWEKGYESTSMRDLLAATGLSKSSLYGSFGTKFELYLSAFDLYREERAAEMTSLLSAGPAREAIKSFFEMIVEDVRSNNGPCGCMSINQAIEMAPQHEVIRSRVLKDLDAIQDALREAVKRGQLEGNITTELGANDIARHLVLGFPGLQLLARAGADWARIDDHIKLLLTCLD